MNQRQVNKIFSHIPKPTLRWWGLQGLYQWTNEFEDKRGITREYGINNLYQIGIVEELSSLDLRLDVIKKIMADIGDKPSMDKVIFFFKEFSGVGWKYKIIDTDNYDVLIGKLRKTRKIPIWGNIYMENVKIKVDTKIHANMAT